MDSIRLGPSSSAGTAQAARHQPGAETAPDAGAFFALLSGWDAQPSAEGGAAAPAEAPGLDLGAPDPAAPGGVLGGGIAAQALPVPADLSAQALAAGTVSVTTPVSAPAPAPFTTQQGVASVGLHAAAAGESGGPVATASRPAHSAGAARGSAHSAFAAAPEAPGSQQGAATAGAAPSALLAGAGDGVPSTQAPAPKDGVPAGGRAGVIRQGQAALPGQGAAAPTSPTPVQDAAAALVLAATSEGRVGGGGLVAQTARLDAAHAGAAGGAVTSPAHRPSQARPAALASAQRFDPLRGLAQVPDPARGGAAVSGAASLGTYIDPRVPLEAGQLPAAPHPVGENSRGPGSDAAGLAAAALPLPIEAAAWATEAHRGRAQTPAGERVGFGSTAVGQAWAEPGSPGVADASGALAAGQTASPEEALAEQVTYWLGENLKNAELTVEHAGQPVEVRVSLTGNEAHIAFRSDQAQTRELLAERMDQLRELLRGEGLVLSGATVDTGASGQPGDQGRRNAPLGAPSASVRAAGETPVQPLRRTLTSSSVDLYV